MREDSSVWDPGPLGSHFTAAAQFLGDLGFIAEDFGAGLEAVAPGMSAMLDAAASQHMTVVTGQHSIELRTVGRAAQGVVVASQRLSLPAQMMPSPEGLLARLTLDVAADVGATYRTTIRWGFRSPQRFAELASPGTPLPLRVDPADRMQVAIDSPALPGSGGTGDRS